MGASVETESLYGVKIADALDTVRAQQPPVCAVSTTQPPDRRAGHTKARDPKNVLERRRMAESINDSRNSPFTAASLGKLCLYW